MRSGPTEHKCLPLGHWGDEPSYAALTMACEVHRDTPRSVRAHIDGLRQALGDAVTDDCLLVGSELASNAVAHGRTPFTFRLRLTARGVLVLVEDEGGPLPAVRAVHEPLSRRGRGLALVAHLASEAGWYAEKDVRSKTVWALISWAR